MSDCAVEECGNYADPKPIDKLFGALRSKHGVPTQLIMTANPGGVGQLWIKERFIDPAPLGMKTLTRELPNGQKHKYIYIPSRVQDNQILLQNDPNYINNLYLVGSKELVKAWLEGSWDAIEGAYFPEFSVDRHVIKPFKIPERWKRYIGYDWGYFSDSACVWIAISDGRDDNGEKVKYPKGSVIVYREWIESKLSNEDQAKKILELSQGEEIEIRAADPSIFASQGGPSIAQQMQDCGLTFHKADNARVAGWSQLRRRLNPGEGLTPMIYFFDACTTAIEAVAVAPVCKKNAEDLDTTFPNDHVLDSVRYCLMENLVESSFQEPKIHATMGTININNLVQKHKAKNRKSKI